MREILFRGKRIDKGEWVNGCLVKGNKSYIISRDNFVDAVVSLDGHLSTFTDIVDEKTIGQYTGLTDKNGTKIFEGDIVLTQEYSTRPFAKNAKRKRLIGVVEYYEQKHYGKNVIYNNGYRVKIKNQGKYICGAWSDFYDCEVIGNIFDNGELLNED